MVKKSKKGLLVVISGPSGVGKSTIVKKLLKAYPELTISVSATTRKARPSEEHGKDYFYLSEEEFKSKVNNGEFFEWALVHGALYGTPKDFVKQQMEKGNTVILEVDVQGAENIKTTLGKSRDRMAGIVFIFIIPPSVDILAYRLKRRRTEGEKELKGRLKTAIAELQLMEKYDYIVVNDHIDTAADKINAIISVEQERAYLN